MHEIVDERPKAIGAEKRVLGALLLDPESLALLADTLRPDHFSQERHQSLYRAMLYFYERHESFDQFTLFDLLKRRGSLCGIESSADIGLYINVAMTSAQVEQDAQTV